MTPQRAKELLPVIQAFAEGKTIQSAPSMEENWLDLTDPLFNTTYVRYRIKPEQKLRPWRPEEVPVGAILKCTSEKFGCHPRTLIIAARGAWVHFLHPVTASLTEVTTNFLCENKDYTHSLDHGKTWLPCGVEE